jgi:hypothetical protein
LPAKNRPSESPALVWVSLNYVMHPIILVNALVVPGLSQNLISHKQFVKHGHMVFFHKNQSGIVLNKEPKFR